GRRRPHRCCAPRAWRSLRRGHSHDATTLWAAPAVVGRAPAARAGDPPIEPFRVDVPDAVLVDLRERLARTRWPDPVAGPAGQYGTDAAYLAELCEHWRTRF